MNESFIFDAEMVRQWSNEINELIGGKTSDRESVGGCIVRFNNALADLVKPDTWNGEGCKANYQMFLDTHNNMVNFFNAFSNTYAQYVTEYAKNVENLEKATLGTNSRIGNVFGTFSFAQLEMAASTNVRDDRVMYNFIVLANILDELKATQSQLRNVVQEITATLGNIGSGSNFWTGGQAETAKEELRKVLNNHMETIDSNITKCISNISGAMDSARAVANGQGAAGSQSLGTASTTYAELDGKKNVYVTPGAAAHEREKVQQAMDNHYSTSNVGPGVSASPNSQPTGGAQVSPTITVGESSSSGGPGVNMAPSGMTQPSPTVTVGEGMTSTAPNVQTSPTVEVGVASGQPTGGAQSSPNAN